jgi:hypothetical protein
MELKKIYDLETNNIDAKSACREPELTATEKHKRPNKSSKKALQPRLPSKRPLKLTETTKREKIPIKRRKTIPFGNF